MKQLTKEPLYFILLILCTILFSNSCSQSTNKRIKKIQVKGNKFVNENGDTIIFRGLCLSDPLNSTLTD